MTLHEYSHDRRHERLSRLAQLLDHENVEGKKYGGKINQEPATLAMLATAIIYINPGKNTGMGVPVKLMQDGLRDHPMDEIEWEVVTNLGYFDGKRTNPCGKPRERFPLVYRFRDLDGSVKEDYFAEGESFCSVVGNFGRYHVLENRSEDAAIRLLITQKRVAITQKKKSQKN